MKALKVIAVTVLVASTWSAHAHEGAVHRSAGPTPKEQKAWGIAGEPRDVKRTVHIDMTDDMRFTPEVIRVRRGEVVRFVIRNKGKLLHEMVIGTPAALEEHAQLMAKFPGMEHEEPHMAHVKPGAQGDMVWNFNRTGAFEFACLVAGHYQAGMKGKIQVLP